MSLKGTWLNVCCWMSKRPDAFAARTGSSAWSSVLPQTKSVAGTPTSACTSVRSSSASRQVSGSSASS